MVGKSQTKGKIKVAVVTGGHEYDVAGFQVLFRSMPEIDFYLQHMEDFVTDTGGGRRQYDAVVFYNMHLATPGTDGTPLGMRTKVALEQLGESEQGIFLLHHAIVAFPKWQLWSDICGIQDRREIAGHVQQRVRAEIASPHHPITRGLAPWEMVDETYTMDEPGEGSEVLLTTDHPASMRAIAWARQYRNARVFSYQSGHDDQAYSDPQFRTVVSRGIQWVVGRI